MEFEGIRTEIANLNAYLVEQNIAVMSLREAEVDLENVFLTVTGRVGSEARGTAAKPVKNNEEVVTDDQ